MPWQVTEHGKNACDFFPLLVDFYFLKFAFE
jgi:hypothetical protein